MENTPGINDRQFSGRTEHWTKPQHEVTGQRVRGGLGRRIWPDDAKRRVALVVIPIEAGVAKRHEAPRGMALV
jgi:hypothetical protein